MAPLELSRAVNDALQNGNFADALAPLQNQLDLRVSDFPKLEKKSLTALSKALQNPTHAEFWAQSLLSTTPSAALFSFRTLTRLGEDALPLVAPLQSALTNIWLNQTPPDAEISDENTSKQRREQELTHARALELMLCLDAETTLEFCRAQVEIYGPIEIERQLLSQEQNRRSELVLKLVQEALQEHISGWGEGKVYLYQMGGHVDKDIYEQTYNRPDIQELRAPYGESVFEAARKSWNPLNSFRGAFSFLAQSKKAPQQQALVKVRGFFHSLLDKGLQPGDVASAQIARAFFYNVAYLDQQQTFDAAPALLKQARPFILTLPAQHPTRILWVAFSQWFFNAFYGYSHNVRSDWDPQDALDLFDVLQLETDMASELNQRFEQARVAYRQNLPEQRAAYQQEQAQLHAQMQAQYQAKMQAKLAAKQTAPLPSELPVRLESENAYDFAIRLSKEYADQNQKAIEQAEINGFAAAVELQGKYKNRLNSIQGEQERQELLFHLAQHADEAPALGVLYELRHLWAQGADLLANRKKLLLSIITPLRDSFERSLKTLMREEKAARGAYPAPQSWQAARQQVDSIRQLLVEAEGGQAELKCINTSRRLKFNRKAQEWENSLLFRLSWWSPLPLKHSREVWLRAKLDDDMDELLEYLATKFPQWSDRQSWDGYHDLALAFYRRFTLESRTRCWQWVAQATGIDPQLIEGINVFDDEEMWLRVLAESAVTHPLFFEMWNRLRADAHNRERIAVAVLYALAETTREGAVTMILQMLGEVELTELAPHYASIAQSAESPHPKVAKWALETLRKMPQADLDWSHLIGIAGEKLWSDNAALNKVAARFIGIVPPAHAAPAWEKLEEALELDNMALVELCAKALVELKRKAPTLLLGEPAIERLKALAQLAPERFAKPLVLLQQ
ncbi:hypothetical protein EON83_19430 [bacterium]|nr:MAG: hypothetical protein EON83_19430 [bacterium]